MIVREDDTLICGECYEDSDEARDTAVLPAHRQVFRTDVRTTEPCSECGKVERPANVRLADRLNAAYAVLRTVPLDQGDRAIMDYEALLRSNPALEPSDLGTISGLPDDVLEAARLLRSL